MSHPHVLGKHDTAVITTDGYSPSLTLVRGSARDYLSEYSALKEKSRKNRKFLTASIIAIVVSLFGFSPPFVVAVLASVEDITVTFSDPSSNGSLSGLEVAGVALFVASLAGVFVFGWRDARIEKALEAAKVRFGAKEFNLFWRSYTPPLPRAWELVLDAVTVEVRDRLFRLLEDEEDEVVASAVRMMTDQADSQARQERDEAGRARRDEVESLAREALGLP